MIPILIPGTSYLSRIDSIYPRVAWEISPLGAWLGDVRKEGSTKTATDIKGCSHGDMLSGISGLMWCSEVFSSRL
jgi:hypothetical protein